MELPRSRCLAFLLFSLLDLSEASHFRGATIQWSPVYSVDGHFTGSVSYSAGSLQCRLYAV